jgi:hypothetical protein
MAQNQSCIRFSMELIKAETSLLKSCDTLGTYTRACDFQAFIKMCSGDQCTNPTLVWDIEANKNEWWAYQDTTFCLGTESDHREVVIDIWDVDTFTKNGTCNIVRDDHLGTFRIDVPASAHFDQRLSATKDCDEGCNKMQIFYQFSTKPQPHFVYVLHSLTRTNESAEPSCDIKLPIEDKCIENCDFRVDFYIDGEISWMPSEKEVFIWSHELESNQNLHPDIHVASPNKRVKSEGYNSHKLFIERGVNLNIRLRDWDEGDHFDEYGQTKIRFTPEEYLKLREQKGVRKHALITRPEGLLQVLGYENKTIIHDVEYEFYMED